jgi:hypothetical protein
LEGRPVAVSKFSWLFGWWCLWEVGIMQDWDLCSRSPACWTLIQWLDSISHPCPLLDPSSGRISFSPFLRLCCCHLVAPLDWHAGSPVSSQKLILVLLKSMDLQRIGIYLTSHIIKKGFYLSFLLLKYE